MSSFGVVEELGQVGDGMCNDLLLRPLGEMHGEDMPPGGFAIRLERKAPVGRLRPRLCERLGVPENGVSFGVEGRELVDDKTIGENGIVEPGPTARRAGTKVNICFMLADGVELGAVVERRKTQREEEERAEAERRQQEQAVRQEAQMRKQADAEAKAKEEAQARAVSEAKSQEEAREADRITVSYTMVGEDGITQILTSKSTTVMELAAQIAEQMGMRTGRGMLRLLYNNGELATGSTLRAANIEEGTQIQCFWEDAGHG